MKYSLSGLRIDFNDVRCKHEEKKKKKYAATKMFKFSNFTFFRLTVTRKRDLFRH